MKKRRSRHQWFLGLDTCKELISISLKEINTHWQLIKDLSPSVQSSKFLKMALHHREPQIFKEGLGLNAFGVWLFLLRNNQESKKCVLDSCLI